MLNRSIFALVAASCISLLAMSLPGCGGGAAAAPSAFFVDPVTGNDTTGNGSATAPYKTLTRAIRMSSAAAATNGANIFAASGLYNAANGESFPLQPAKGENLIGDIATKGSTRIISGNGSYTFAASGIYGGAGIASIAFASGVTASVQGFTINSAGNLNVAMDSATNATLTSNTISGGGCLQNVTLMVGSRATLTNNIISGAANAGVTLDASATATLRGNVITQSAGTLGAVLSGQGGSTGQMIDLGTAASPGGNTITGAASGVGFYVMGVAGTATIPAVGNTWKASVQGADTAGHYAAGLIPPTAFAAGNNYANTGSGIQF